MPLGTSRKRAGTQPGEAFKAEKLNQAQQQEIVAEPGHGAGERDFSESAST
jgi:hypothetical protein